MSLRNKTDESQSKIPLETVMEGESQEDVKFYQEFPFLRRRVRRDYVRVGEEYQAVILPVEALPQPCINKRGSPTNPYTLPDQFIFAHQVSSNGGYRHDLHPLSGRFWTPEAIEDSKFSSYLSDAHQVVLRLTWDSVRKASCLMGTSTVSGCFAYVRSTAVGFVMDLLHDW